MASRSCLDGVSFMGRWISLACTRRKRVFCAKEISANCGSCSIPGNFAKSVSNAEVSVCCELFVGAVVHVAISGRRRMLGPSTYVTHATIMVHDLRPSNVR